MFEDVNELSGELIFSEPREEQKTAVFTVNWLENLAREEALEEADRHYSPLSTPPTKTLNPDPITSNTNLLHSVSNFTTSSNPASKHPIHVKSYTSHVSESCPLSSSSIIASSVRNNQKKHTWVDIEFLYVVIPKFHRRLV